MSEALPHAEVVLCYRVSEETLAELDLPLCKHKGSALCIPRPMRPYGIYMLQRHFYGHEALVHVMMTFPSGLSPSLASVCWLGRNFDIIDCPDIMLQSTPEPPLPPSIVDPATASMKGRMASLHLCKGRPCTSYVPQQL